MTKLYEDVEIISKLPDAPTLSAAQLKGKFDEGNVIIKNFINEVLIPEILSALEESGQNSKEGLENLKGSIPALALSLEEEGEGKALSLALGKALKESLEAKGQEIQNLAFTLGALQSALNQKQNKVLCGQGNPTGGENGDIYLMY